MDEIPKDKDNEFREFVGGLRGEATLAQVQQAQQFACMAVDDSEHQPVALLDSKVQSIADRLRDFYQNGVNSTLLDTILASYQETAQAPKDFDDYVESLPITGEEKTLLRTIRDQKQKGVLRVEMERSHPGQLTVTHTVSEDIVIPPDIEISEELIISMNLLDKIRRVVGREIPSRLKFSFQPLDIMPAAETKGPDTFFEVLDEKRPYARALEELRTANIPTVVNEAELANEKFDSKKVLGRIGEYECTRSWRYWEVKGSIPLSVAQKLYENPIGKKYVRFGGYSGGQDPEKALQKIPGGYVTNKQGEPLILGGCHIDTQEGLNLFSRAVTAQAKPKLRRIQ